MCHISKLVPIILQEMRGVYLILITILMLNSLHLTGGVIEFMNMCAQQGRELKIPFYHNWLYLSLYYYVF